jgi:hypothetical protein
MAPAQLANAQARAEVIGHADVVEPAGISNEQKEFGIASLRRLGEADDLHHVAPKILQQRPVCRLGMVQQVAACDEAADLQRVMDLTQAGEPGDPEGLLDASVRVVEREQHDLFGDGERLRVRLRLRVRVRVRVRVRLRLRLRLRVRVRVGHRREG